MSTPDTKKDGIEVALLAIGGSLLASAIGKSEQTAAANVRADLLWRYHSKFRRVRTKAKMGQSLFELVIGGALVAYSLSRIAKNAVDPAPELPASRT